MIKNTQMSQSRSSRNTIERHATKVQAKCLHTGTTDAKMCWFKTTSSIELPPPPKMICAAPAITVDITDVQRARDQKTCKNQKKRDQNFQCLLSYFSNAYPLKTGGIAPFIANSITVCCGKISNMTSSLGIPEIDPPSWTGLKWRHWIEVFSIFSGLVQ